MQEDHTTIRGEIPARIVYVLKPPRTLESHYPDVDPIEVRPAFPVPADKNLGTARGWATRYEKGYNTPEEIEVANEPFGPLRLWDLHRREEGGRAYKAIIPPNFYVDLREDVFMDVIFKHGVGKGGHLDGKYVWGRLGSQMRLVLVGSSLHMQLRHATLRATLKKIPVRELQVGTLYRTKTGQLGVYLGKMKPPFAGGKPKMAWQEVSKYDFERYGLDPHLLEESAWFYLGFRSSHSYIEPLGSLQVDPQAQVTRMVKQFEEHLAEENAKRSPWGLPHNRESYLQRNAPSW